MMRLDQLQPLVHHGGAIDRDLGAHVPIGMIERHLRSSPRSMVSVLEAPARTVHPTPSAPGARRVSLAFGPLSAWKMALCSESTGSRVAPCAVDLVHEQRARGDQAFLGGKSDHRTAADGLQASAGSPAAPTIAAITQSARQGGCEDQPFRPGGDLDAGCRSAPPSTCRIRSKDRDHRKLGVMMRLGEHAASSSTLRCAVSASTRKRGGIGGDQIERALADAEPVAPRTVTERGCVQVMARMASWPTIPCPCDQAPSWPAPVLRRAARRPGRTDPPWPGIKRAGYP